MALLLIEIGALVVLADVMRGGRRKDQPSG